MTIFYKDGNKVLRTETFNEGDEEKIIKEHVTSLSKDNRNSQRDDNVENLDDIKKLQMIEAGEKKGQLKDDHVYSLNNLNDD